MRCARDVESISAQELHERWRRGFVDLIDVRRAAQFAEAHVPMARSVPAHSLDPQAVMRERGARAGEPLHVICQGGIRSIEVCRRFIDAGFEEVVNVEGGTRAWREAGFPVEGESERIRGSSRRKFLAFFSGLSALLAAAGCILPRWLGGRRSASREEPLAVDVLVVGGGVQGLAILGALKERGYSVALVTNAALGSGQTLHSHGVLNSGYPYPRKALRDCLQRDWLPFAERKGLQLHGQDRFFILSPPKALDGLRRDWDAFGYPHENVARECLPPAIRESSLLRDSADTRVVRIDEYTFPKRQLIRILSDGLQDRILYGRIERCRCASRDAGDPSPPTEESTVVESVEIRTRAGKTVTLKPRLLVTAAGTGTRKLIRSLIEDSSPEAGLRDSKHWKEVVVSQVDEVTCRNTHMICIRGPRDVLPAVNLLVLELGLMIITATVDSRHERRSDDPRDRVTWYVTPMDPHARPTRSPPDTARGIVEERVVVDGFRKLLELFPSLREKARRPDRGIECAVYAGYKQDIGSEKNRPFCRRLKGLDNVIVTLPSLIPGALVNAGRVLELVERSVEPSGEPVPLAGAAGGIEIGEVTENTGEVEWMSWSRLREAYPGIEDEIPI